MATTNAVDEEGDIMHVKDAAAAAEAANKIQRWFSAKMERTRSREMIRLLSLALPEKDGELDEVQLFLQCTLLAPEKYHPALLAMLRAKYLAHCQTRAREEISVETYQTLVEGVILCGGTPHSEAQTTDYELKSMLETWEREMASPGYIQTKHEQQMRSNEVKQAVKRGNSEAYLRTMVDKGAFDTGFALRDFSKVRKSAAQSGGRRDTPAKQLLRKLSSKRFSLSFRNAATINTNELTHSHNAMLEELEQRQQQQQPASPASSKFASFASPFKRRSSVAFLLPENHQQQQEEQQLGEEQAALLPMTDAVPNMDADQFRDFRLSSQFFQQLVHNARRGEDVSAELARFLNQNSVELADSLALRTEIFYQVLHDLASRPIRNESDEGGEFVLVKHALGGSEHVISLLCVLLTVCQVPSELGPYVLAFIVQRLGRGGVDDPVSEKLISLIRIEAPIAATASSSSSQEKEPEHFSPQEIKAKFVEFDKLMPERPKMQIRKRVLDAMRHTSQDEQQVLARQLFSPHADSVAIELEEKQAEEDNDAVAEIPAPIRMDSEERELRENFTVCQMMYDFNGEGGEQYLKVSKGEILWLSGLNSSKEWAKVYRREDQRVGWVPLSFVGYPGYE